LHRLLEEETVFFKFTDNEIFKFVVLESAQQLCIAAVFSSQKGKMEISFTDRVLYLSSIIFLAVLIFAMLVFIAAKFDKIKYKSEFIFIIVLFFIFILALNKMIIHFCFYRAVFSDLTTLDVKTIDSFKEIRHNSSCIGIGFVVNGLQELEYPSSAPHFYSVYHVMRYNKQKELLTVWFYPKTWSTPNLYQIEAGNKIIVSFNESVEYQKRQLIYCVIFIVAVVAAYLAFRTVAIKKEWFIKIDQKLF
jgi:hypothetical protein